MLLHLLNFVAPAVWMAIGLPSLSRLALRGFSARLPWHEQVGVQLVLGILVLLAGLVLLGRDGAMLTYGALVLLGGAAQWAMLCRR